MKTRLTATMAVVLVALWAESAQPQTAYVGATVFDGTGADPIEDAVVRFRGMRFEPMGMTSNPDIPEASSIVDYVARYLEHQFVQGGAGQTRISRDFRISG